MQEPDAATHVTHQSTVDLNRLDHLKTLFKKIVLHKFHPISGTNELIKIQSDLMKFKTSKNNKKNNKFLPSLDLLDQTISIHPRYFALTIDHGLHI